MLEIIFFVVAVILWDGFKKKIRGSKIPTVSIKRMNIVKAKCGCSIEDGKIIRACAAHQLLVRL